MNVSSITTVGSIRFCSVSYTADDAHRPLRHRFAAAALSLPWDRQTDGRTDRRTRRRFRLELHYLVFLWICCGLVVDSLRICCGFACTASGTATPQQIEAMGFER